MASRIPAAGFSLATVELRLFLLEAGGRMVARCLYCRPALYADDATIETVCALRMGLGEHVAAADGPADDQQSIPLQLSALRKQAHQCVFWLRPL